MRSRRRWILPISVVAGLGAVFTLWSGWQVWQVNRELAAAVSDASRLQAAVLDDDTDAQATALAGLQEHSRTAADRTQGLTWAVLAHLPVFGDDAGGVQVVSDVVADVSEQGIEPLVETTSQLDALLPRNGRISIEAVARLQQPVADGEAAFADADQRLDDEDPASYVGRLRDKYRDLAGRVSDAHDALRAADTALTVMPGMLGGDAPRNYLLVFQNNAEIRSSGGLPGAVSLLRADDGKIAMKRQVAGNSFGERETSVLPLTPAEQQIYGEELGTYFLDANFTPDFPRTADLMRARWEETSDDQVDGVLSIDTVALSYILGAVGPVTAGGLELTADNVVDQLLHQVYVDNPNPAAQDAVFREVARAVFDRVTQGAGSATDLASALTRASNEHRLYVHSFDGAEQEVLDPTEVSGHLTPDDPTSPLVGLYLNDGTGSKMSYYLRYRARVDSTYCYEGVQGLAGSARLSSVAPDDASALPPYITGGGTYGTEPGNQLVRIRLYAPVGGSISDVELNSRPVDDLTVVLQDDRPVTTINLELAPGQMVDLTWHMRSGADQPGPVRMSVTPGVEAGTSSSTSVSSCA